MVKYANDILKNYKKKNKKQWWPHLKSYIEGTLVIVGTHTALGNAY